MEYPRRGYSKRILDSQRPSKSQPEIPPKRVKQATGDFNHKAQCKRVQQAAGDFTPLRPVAPGLEIRKCTTMAQTRRNTGVFIVVQVYKNQAKRTRMRAYLYTPTTMESRINTGFFRYLYTFGSQVGAGEMDLSLSRKKLGNMRLCEVATLSCSEGLIY